MNFWQVTIGDLIGYLLIIVNTTISISLVIKMNFTSHHNKKKNIKINQSSSVVGGDQIGGDKR